MAFTSVCNIVGDIVPFWPESVEYLVQVAYWYEVPPIPPWIKYQAILAISGEISISTGILLS